MGSSAFAIRPACLQDEAALLKMLPRLAEFELSPRRRPEDLWESDAKLLKALLRGEAPRSFALAAVDPEQAVAAGLALVTLQGEFMSGQPSAHLEVLAVAEGYEGRGLGRMLLAAAEAQAQARGAQAMTLHVFNKNHRAHGLYESVGYDSEVQRCIKWL